MGDTDADGIVIAEGETYRKAWENAAKNAALLSLTICVSGSKMDGEGEEG